MCVYPACAGIDPMTEKILRVNVRLPRMRGDRPSALASSCFWEAFTPHARGSTALDAIIAELESVYPACAGIDLSLSSGRMPALGLPRMRGDRPHPWRLRRAPSMFTPHARGSTLCPFKFPWSYLVYPACAGIDRLPSELRGASFGLPRMRGDRPHTKLPRSKKRRFTPHARGSTKITVCS